MLRVNARRSSRILRVIDFFKVNDISFFEFVETVDVDFEGVLSGLLGEEDGAPFARWLDIDNLKLCVDPHDGEIKEHAEHVDGGVGAGVFGFDKKKPLIGG